MSSAETLRAKQNMEILDIFKNLNSQVNALTRRQISVFPDTMKPKTQRDLEVEVNVDKSVESINRLLEMKITSLEFVIQNTDLRNLDDDRPEEERTKRTAYQQSFTSLVNTGDIIPLFNGIVRYYQKIGLSKQSQEMVKIKVQDLDANLEAILYGLTQLIDTIFEKRQFSEIIGLRLLDLLRTKSIFQLISRQVDTSTFQLIDVSLMDASFQNIFAELSQDRRELLSTVSQRGAIGETPIRKIPTFSTQNFSARIKAIADEIGVDVSRIPENLIERLRKMNQPDFEKFADNAIREVQSRAEKFAPAEQRRLQELDSKIKDLENIVTDLNDLDRVERNLRSEIIRLEHDEDDEKFDESMLEDVPELPIAPVRPSEPNPRTVDYYNAYLDYYTENEEFERLSGIRATIIENNQFIRERAEAKSRDEKDEMIAEKIQQVEEIDLERTRLREEYEVVEAERDQIERLIRASKNNRLVRLSRDMIDLQEKNYSLQETRGMGKSKDVATRGLASMRANYGYFDSESESGSEQESEDEDALDFDDTRNEMYYTRPARK